MPSHLLPHVQPLVERSLAERAYFIKSPRWIGYSGAMSMLDKLNELLNRPPHPRMSGYTIVGPYNNGKTMIVERFVIQDLKKSPSQRAWVVQTGEGAGLAHFYTSIIRAFKAPMKSIRSVHMRGEQLNQLLFSLKPRVLIFDEFHNALRGRRQDVDAIFSFLRRLGRDYDISPVLVGDITVRDYINAPSRGDEMASRIEHCYVPRWKYGDEFLDLLDGLESVTPLAKPSGLSDEPLARRIFTLSEGLIGEVVAIVNAAALAAIQNGTEQITLEGLNAIDYVPLSERRNAPDIEGLT